MANAKSSRAPDSALRAAKSPVALAYLRLLVAAEPASLDLALLAVGILAAITAGVPFPLIGIIFGQLVDDLNSATCDAAPASAAAYSAAINSKVLQLTYLAIGSFVAIYIYVLCWNIFGQRLAQRLRERYLRSLLRQEASFFDSLPTGEVSSRLHGDILLVQSGVSEKVGICIASFSFFVTAYVVAFIKDAKLAGMLVSLVPAFLLMSLAGGYFVQRYTGRMSEHAAAAAAVASEGLSHVAVVHAFGAGPRLESKFAASLALSMKDGVKKAVAAAVQSGLLYFIAYSANALAFWQGSRVIAAAVSGAGSTITVGQTYTVIFLLVDASIILSQVAPFLQIFGAASAAYQKLHADIEHLSAIDGTADTGHKLADTTGAVELRGVHFTYPSRPEHPVLRDVSLVCPAGKHTAIVGLSGSGKSTIAGLVTRLYDPTKGAILLDGHDIRELNVRNLRSFISLVQQEPSLLDRSILENVALGLVNSPKPAHAHLQSTLLGAQLSEVAAAVRGGQDVDKAAQALGPEAAEIVELVRQAATSADAAGFVGRLENGYGTLVGSSGSLISGGQKQRIALARALIRDPSILVLDEATAALDSVSEHRIQAAIDDIAAGRTVISIAHRLSTIRNADNIIVINAGRIVEQGTHAELVALDGAYASMVHLQSLNSDGAQSEMPSRTATLKDSIDSLPADVEKIVAGDAAEPLGGSKQESGPSKAVQSDDSKDAGLDSGRSTWTIMRSLSWLVRPYILALLIAFLASAVVGGTYSSAAVIFGNTVSSMSPCNTPSFIRSQGKFFALLFFVLAVIEFFANFISWALFGWFSEKLLYKVRVLAFRALFEQDLQWHQSLNRNPTMLLSFITKDGSALGGLTGSITGTIFSIVVNFIIAIILSHIVAWKIAIVCLVTVPILLGAGFMQFRALARFEERYGEAFAKSVNITVEAVSSIKTVATLSIEDEILRSYRRSVEAPRKAMFAESAYTNIWLAIANSIGNMVYAFAYWWGAKQILAGLYTPTDFFIVIIAMLVSAQLWGQMFTLAPEVSRARSAVSRIVSLLDIGSTKRLDPQTPLLATDTSSTEKDIEAVADAPPTTHQPDGGVSVTFNNVSFAYPARPHARVLQDLSLTVQPGQFCALVGPSGAGKSTVISLLERMYSPASGSIEIDGVDIARYAGSQFRDTISLVPQDSVLFAGSVRFNVGLGARPGYEATDEEIQAACALANMHDTIAALPQGYDTECGTNGSQLSGGQRQRLAIARALVRRPRLLLLDESTSALDAESEKLLQDGLERAARGITVIAIAHRLHTIRKADVIFVIEGGRVVDRGRHEELIERSESYRTNALHQMLGD